MNAQITITASNGEQLTLIVNKEDAIRILAEYQRKYSETQSAVLIGTFVHQNLMVKK